jgi:uncharacterized RDD family membrane protein YckC
MKTWFIRVVDREGNTISQGRALVRYFLSWIWFLPPLAVGDVFNLPGGEITVLTIGWVLVWALLARFHSERQFWHDAWAGTRLVHHQPPEPPKRKKPGKPT